MVNRGGDSRTARRLGLAAVVVACLAGVWLAVRGAIDRGGLAPEVGPDRPGGVPAADLDAPKDPDRSAVGSSEENAGSETGDVGDRRATIHGWLESDQGSRPDRGRVSIFDTDRSVLIGPDGSFTFHGVAPGTVRFEVHDLPEPYLAPYRQSKSLLRGKPRIPGWGPQFFQIAPGENEIEIAILQSCSVSGIVVGPEGEPVAGVAVSTYNSDPVHAKPGLMGPVAGEWTDEFGLFSLRGVYPGLTRVRIGVPRSHPYWSVPAPVTEIQLVGSADLRIQLGSGPHTLAGRVVLDDERPLANVDVLVFFNPTPGYEWIPDRYNYNDRVAETVTDEEGKFEIVGMEAGMYSIRAARNLAPRTGPGSSPLARLPDLVHVDVPTGRDVRIVASQSRPFRLSLSVLEEDGAPSSDRTGVTVDILQEGAERIRLPLRHGRVEWMCEPPHDPVVVEILRYGEVVRTLDVIPDPETTVERSAILPPHQPEEENP